MSQTKIDVKIKIGMKHLNQISKTKQTKITNFKEVDKKVNDIDDMVSNIEMKKDTYENKTIIQNFERYFNLVYSQINEMSPKTAFTKYEVKDVITNIYNSVRNQIQFSQKDNEKIIFTTFDMVNNDIFKIVQDVNNPYLFKVYTTTFIQYSKMDTKEGIDYMIEKLMRMNFIHNIDSIKVNSISRTKIDTLVSWIFRIEFIDDSYKIYH